MNPKEKIQGRKTSRKSNKKMDPKTTAVSNTESTERKKWINQNREEYDQFIERKKWVNQNREEYELIILYDQSIDEITSAQWSQEPLKRT